MDPEKKSLNFFFPTKYVVPKSLKFSHWLSETHPGAGCKAVVHFFFASFRGGPRPMSLKICRGHNIRSEQMRLAVGLTSRETVVFFFYGFHMSMFSVDLGVNPN